LQGSFKYGLYEFFKKQYSDIAGEKNAYEYRTWLYLAASASAEVFADVALCPLEALKVRMQTSSQPFSTSFLGGVSKISSSEGISGFYKGLVPLWGRQIPYTMMKFASFERTVESIYKYALSKPKHEYSKCEQLGVTFVAGYIAGILCAVVSHPADTLVSKLNNMPKANPGEPSGVSRVLKEVGFSGLWRGLSARIVMVGTLTALQWFVYDTFKVTIGLPTSGAAKPKDE
jgi:solute carrier family 25 (mitochondrial phosphate transporter), member 3